MGYNIRAGMVEENKHLLMVILAAYNRGRELRLRPDSADDTVYQLQMRIRRVLKATEVLENECDGAFYNLGKKVALNVDNETKELIVRARKVTGGRFAESKQTPDEDMALAQLSASKGTMEMLIFNPSPHFDELDFIERVTAAGWSLLLETKSEDGGQLMYAAERESAESTSPLGRYGR